MDRDHYLHRGRVASISGLRLSRFDCGCRPKPTPKANSGPQKVRPGSRLAAHGPLSLNGAAKKYLANHC
jgi:hypothetical protein